jgi:hypothetical protein
MPAALCCSGRIFLHEEIEVRNLQTLFVNILNQARQQVIQKQMSGLNIVGTIAGRLCGKGRFEECLQIENMWHETIRQFSIPITLMCTYEKPIDESHRTHFAECHSGGIYAI